MKTWYLSFGVEVKIIVLSHRLKPMTQHFFYIIRNCIFYYTKSLRQALKVEIKHKKLFRKQEEWKDVKDPL